MTITNKDTMISIIDKVKSATGPGYVSIGLDCGCHEGNSDIEWQWTLWIGNRNENYEFNTWDQLVSFTNSLTSEEDIVQIED